MFFLTRSSHAGRKEVLGISKEALEQAHGNKSQAAKTLGLSRIQLRVRMRQYGLEDG